MDISKALLAKSNQLNASDLMGGPQIVSIVSVNEGSDEQPVNIITDVFGAGRPFRPSKTVLLILANAWKSNNTSTWVGKRMEIFRDASVTWAGQEVGGIRIKGLSHIDKPFSLVLATSKTKFAKSTFAVLPDIAEPANAATPPRDASGRAWLTELTLAGDDLEAVAALGKAASDAHANPADVAQIRARWNELKGTNA